MYLNPNDFGVSAGVGKRGVYEPATTELIKKVVKKGMCVMDIGANIGWYTLHSARLVERTGHVFAFEPEPNNFNFLAKNVKVNALDNVTIYQEIVSDVTCYRELFISNEPGGHSILYNPLNRSILCRSTTVDDFLATQSQKTVDVIKIDAEGSEPLIIYGGRKTLERSPPIIIMEFLPRLWPTKHKDLKIFSEILRDYSIWQIVNTPFLIKQLTLAKLFAMSTSNPSIHINLFMAPKRA